MGYEEIKNKYLDYLMDRAGLEKDGDDGYLEICRRMQEIEFFPIIEMDENRCAECIGLRKDFEEIILEYDLFDEMYGELSDTGTFLELLIVMAEKMRYELSDSQYEASTRKWMLEMMGNCGLEAYATNRDYAERNGEQAVGAIADTVIFREIGWDGEDGLFPLFMAQRDQRRIELVMQMNDYLQENYDIC